MGEKRNMYRVLAGKPERKSHLEDLGAEGTIILIWLLKKGKRRELVASQE
jgi:hypothetical protein